MEKTKRKFYGFKYMCGISTTWGPRYEAAGTLYAFETKKARDEWVDGNRSLFPAVKCPKAG